ncbi:uncharacterized protein A4U43_UnF10570, partial [Asparagus officinalis]
GVSPSYTCRINSNAFQHKNLSLPSQRFIQFTRRQCLYNGVWPFLSSKTHRWAVYAESGQKSWDFRSFFRTLYFFNGPPNPAKNIASLLEKVSSSTSIESVEKMETSDIVLVAGATGGVGRRVVDILRKQGLPVRALVRNKQKARTMLGPDVDLVVGDITKEETLAPEYFKGVKEVINAVSVIVGPKEGDTPDREKYSQGIKFFEPEIKGDSPEKVEYIGMRNLINALQSRTGLRDGKLLFGLKGTVSTANNGGFTSIRTKNFSIPEDLSAYGGIEMRVKGDGRRYKLIVHTSSDRDTVGYTASFDTKDGQWPVFRARTKDDALPFDPSHIFSLQLMYSKFEYDGKLNPTFVEGAFQLPFSSIRAYMNEPLAPRWETYLPDCQEEGERTKVPCDWKENPRGM